MTPPSTTVAEGRWWVRQADGRIRCELCPRFCQLRPGQRGFCYVRKNVDNKMCLDTYGRASGFCLDPIEKKPLSHFLPGTSVLSFGTAGCNLGCKFCQNWNISSSRADDQLTDRATPEAIAEVAQARGARSVAFTYNDPVIFAEYAIDTARACRSRGVAAVAVTAGYIGPEARRDFFAELDAVNIDLKAFSARFYRKLCFAQLGPVLETLEYVKRETDVWLEVTTLLIPTENDSPEEVDRLCEWFAKTLGPDVPLHFSAFHPDFKMNRHPPTPPSTLLRARAQAQAHGLRYVYTGNISSEATQSTLCPGCGETVIGRDGYAITQWGLDAQGRCQHCQTSIAGRFEAKPGTWGPTRRRIRVLAS